MMDSGFCVSRGIVELERMGVYGASFIKKAIIGQKVCLVLRLMRVLKTRM